MALLMRKPSKTGSISAMQSTTLVKNLFRAAFSSVAYIRNFFEDDCFQLGKIGTTRYHKIVSLERDDVKFFVDWLEQGIFDALQKKYLEVVLLEVSEGPHLKKSKKKENVVKRKLLECYTFNVSYTDGNPQLALAENGCNGSTDVSKEQIKQTTGEVLRSLVQLTSLLDPLPANHIISMKLLYTKNTPAEYEPPLFQKAPDYETCWFEETPSHMDAGVVTTPFHQLSMAIQAGRKTAGKENRYSDKKNKKSGDINADNTCRREKKGKTGLRSDEECDRGATLPDVGSSSANPGRVEKRFLAGSQEMAVDGGTNHSFDLQSKESDIKKKNNAGINDVKDLKLTRLTQSGKKRKASATVKEIIGVSKKRLRGKKTE